VFQYEARIVRIKDGDTLTIEVDLGFHIRHEIDVRLARIDTPEIVNYGANGITDKARDYVEACCPVGSVCIVNISRAEKYGRWLAEILFQPGQTDRKKIIENPRVLNDELLRGGFARPYSGGRKK
jgi:endonuclease YncB( thermonuclease family)